MSNAFDNSYQTALNNGARAAEQNKPQPTQQYGQTHESHTNALNQYHSILNKK